MVDVRQLEGALSALERIERRIREYYKDTYVDYVKMREIEGVVGLLCRSAPGLVDPFSIEDFETDEIDEENSVLYNKAAVLARLAIDKRILRGEIERQNTYVEYVQNSDGPWGPSMWELVHPEVRRVAKNLFNDGYYADAALAAMREVNGRVKQIVKGKIGAELDGAALMRQAFSPKKPVVILDDLSTESGRNIQQGYMEIFAGAMMGIRNPKAHENITITRERGLHFLVLASLLMSKLDESLEEKLRGLQPTYEEHNDVSARGWPAEKQCQCENCKEYRALSN